MPTRYEIVDKAREYLKTPFRHQGRMKGKGCDCVGLPLMVAEEFGLLDIKGVPLRGLDHRDYTPTPVNDMVKQHCDARLRSKPVADIKPGDVVLIKYSAFPTHVGIISDIQGQGLGLIHAYNGLGEVVEHILSEPYRRRIVSAYEFPGVTD